MPTRAQKYKNRLERALHYTVFDGTVRVVQNKDRSIDAELVIPIPRGVDAEEVIDEIEEELTVPRDAWLTVGVRLEPSGVSRVAPSRFDDYNQFRGMVDITIQPGKVYRKGDIFERARVDIVEGLRAKRHNKPKEVVVRLHWDPKGRKPFRKGES